MKFAEFYAGQIIEAGPYTVSAAEIVEFARDWDPQWFHTDPESAQRSRFGGLIASGWHTAGIAMRLAVDDVLAGSESYASPGLEYLKWTAPVRPGDSLRLRLDVNEVRQSNSNPSLGILKWRWQVSNQDDELVLDMGVTSLFDLGSG